MNFLKLPELLPLFLFASFLQTISCNEANTETIEIEVATEIDVEVEVTDESVADPSLVNPNYILNSTELPDWIDDPMLIETLSDGRIIVVGYSSSDSMAMISPNLENVEGYSFQGGQGTLTAIRSDGLSIYALIVLIINKYDIRSGRHMDVFGALGNSTYWSFDYNSGMFLTISTPNNTDVLLRWINSSGTIIQTVEDPLRVEGDDNPLLMVPNGVALDSNQNAWVTSGADDRVFIYRMNGQLLTSFYNTHVPVSIRRYGSDKMVIGSGQPFRVYDLDGEQVQSGMFPDHCIDFAFTANGNVVAITQRGVIHLMDIPCLYDYGERPHIR